MQVVDLFLDSLKSKHTKDKYKYHWERFQKYLPNAKELKAPERLTESIISYLMRMKAEGLSHSYRSVALAAIKHWYEMKDVLLNWKKIAKFLGETTIENENKAYTREQIAAMVNVADIKYKAIILIYASTGMRREPLTELKMGDFEYLDEYQLYKITIYRGTKSKQVCFTSPETAIAIKKYLQIKPKKKGDYFHPVDPKAVSTHLRQIAIEAGVSSKKPYLKSQHGRFRGSIPATHGLRKWCITQMALAKVDTEVAKLLTGHSIGVRAKYLNYSDEDLLAEFTKAIPLLTISHEEKYEVLNKQLEIKNQKFVESVDSRLKAKDEEIQELTKKVEELSAEDEEIKTLRAEFEGLKEQLRKKIEEPEVKRLVKGTAKNIIKKTTVRR